MIIEKLAEFSVALDLNKLDSQCVKWAKLCLLDGIECCIDSFVDNRTESALATALEESGDCTLIGHSEKTSVSGAVLYNTVVGSVASRNDMNIEGNAHPATAMVPLVLALGESKKVSGKRVLEALIVGYEVLMRFGRALKGNGAKIHPSMRATSLGIALASSFAASKILGFDENLTCQSASMACHYVSGLNEWRFKGTGEDVYLNALAAEYGIFCTRIAKNGMRAVPENLEGEYGLLSLFNARDNANQIIEGLDNPEAVIKTHHKPVAACRALQTVCLVTEKIFYDNDISSEDIDSVVLTVSEGIRNNPWYFRQVNVTNLVQAILSIPFGFAATAFYRKHENIKWVPPYDKHIAELMSKICIRFDANYGRDAIRVDIKMKNGAVKSGSMDSFPFFSENDIVDKFMDSVSKIAGHNRTEQLCKKIMNLEDINDITEISVLLNYPKNKEK